MVQTSLAALQNTYPEIVCLEVFAYMPGQKEDFQIPKKLETIYPDGLENTPRKFAIDRRNRWMVEQSEVVICFVKHPYSGAFKFVEMARRKGKKIINLADTTAGSPESENDTQAERK